MFHNPTIEKKLLVALTTFYPSLSQSDNCRSELAEKTIQALIDNKYKVVVLDGGSHKNFLQKIQQYEINLFKQKKKGLGFAKREVIQAAYNEGGEIILQMEPEKVDLVRHIKDLLQPFSEQSTDMVVPKRASLDSYPVVQQHAELLTNIFCRELTGNSLDMSFGPTLFRRGIAKYYLEYNGIYGDTWDALHIPILMALKDGKNIKSITIQYNHPQEQTKLEEHDITFYKKRIIDQLVPIVEAYEQYWKKNF